MVFIARYSYPGGADLVMVCVIVHLIRQDTGPGITDFVPRRIVAVGSTEDVRITCNGLCHSGSSFYEGRRGRGDSAPEIRGNVRSNDGFNSAAFAGIYGGGGHLRAAGFTVRDRKIDALADEVRERVEKLL